MRSRKVCASEEAARILHLKTGMQMEWSAWGRSLRTRLACIERTDSVRMTSRFEFLFSQGSLDGFPAIYYGSARVRPAAVAAMQRAIYEKMPTITVINMADVLEIEQEVVNQIALVVRFVSAFTIVAGAIILASSVAGTRFRRIREVVILKVLGATRRRVAGIFSVEFLVLGGAAGLLGSALATGFAALVVKRLLKGDFHFNPGADLFSIALTALVANAAGWLERLSLILRAKAAGSPSRRITDTFASPFLKLTTLRDFSGDRDGAYPRARVSSAPAAFCTEPHRAEAHTTVAIQMGA